MFINVIMCYIIMELCIAFVAIMKGDWWILFNLFILNMIFSINSS